METGLGQQPYRMGTLPSEVTGAVRAPSAVHMEDLIDYHLEADLRGAVCLCPLELGDRDGRDDDQGRPTGPGKMRQAYFWPIFGENNEIVFHYAPSREHRHVENFLGDFEGTLLSDGYQAYETWAAARGDVVVHAACWAHTRREIETIKDQDPVRCREALDLIGGLYAHEENSRKKKLAGSAKLALRREHSVPIVEAFWRWCRTIVEDLLLAVNYARNRRDALDVCLSDPDVPDRYESPGGGYVPSR